MVNGICDICKKEKKVQKSKEGKNICKPCYKKTVWSPKPIICTRCGKTKIHHSKGMCAGCYNSTFHIDKVKVHNAKRYHNISEELYKRTIERCKICGFDKIVEIHHLDHNHQNNSGTNLVGLCPNCHKLVHSKKYQKEVFEDLKLKGFKVPESSYSDGFFKK